MGLKLGSHLFCSCDVGFYGGYLGVMAKLGPFWSRDNCSLVRGVLDKLMTHLLVWLVHVWLLLEGGSPVVELEAVVLMEVGGSGCGRNCWIAGIWSGRVDESRWHILVSTQAKVFLIDVFNVSELPVEIMMASISFVIESFKLIDLFFLNFVVSVFFDLINEMLTPF